MRGDAFRVEEIPSPRWELALDLLREGSRQFLIPGDVNVGMRREVGWPDADGRIHVLIFTTVEPSAVSIEMAQHDVNQGLEAVRRAEAADPELSRLFKEHGVVYEYLHDYELGAVKIADVDQDGLVSLL